ncbi:protein disulfide-isomerase A6 [Mytilus galloprovincialis]|uniref:Protein disulfide-isomerase A6 n=1 Tax=Mytilus galloprovincialis TaxID=29158 RepID=A0A8B6BFU8_MYTGA|nr:protein disulfide-isomerase A6 [Mytilus galloprovincialis]
MIGPVAQNSLNIFNRLKVLQNDGKFLIIYVTNGCHECNLAYSKFVAASQPFDREEIRFGRIQHTGLAATLEIDTFPSLIYFKANSYQVNRAKIDITVDSIIQLISDVTKRDFIYMDKHYTVEVNKANFDDTLNTPRQCKLLLLYTNENKDKVEWFDDLAELFKNDDKIMFARLNVHREGELKDRFKARAFPALYWYSDDEIPRKSMYGGRFDKIEIMAFIADKTGITRQQNGALPEGAGLLKEMDELIKANKNTIASGKKMKKIVQKAKEFLEYYDDRDMQEIAEYYVYLLEEVEYHEETSVIDDERYYLIRELVDPKGPRQRELLLKKQNVVRQFFDIMGDKLLKRNSKQSPIVKAKEPRPHNHHHDKIHRHEEL